MIRRHPKAKWMYLLLLVAFVLSGCTAVPQSSPAHQPASSPQCTEVDWNTRTGEITKLPAYDHSSIIFTGLAGDIAEVTNYINNLDPSLPAVKIELPFTFDGNTPQPIGKEGQQGWFTATLGTTDESRLAIAENLFGNAPTKLDESDTLTFAKAKIGKNTENPKVTDLTEPNLPFAALAQVIAASDELYAKGTLRLPVFAELNRRVSLPKSLSIDPNGVGAHGCGPLAGSTATPGLFWSQWALQPLPGINVFPASPDLGCTSAGSSTERVRVVVFDTSPAPLPNGTPVGATTSWLSFDLSAPCGRSPLDLEVSSFLTSTMAPSGWSQHGLFSAGLVYAGWRHAKIHLARVMDNDGQGDLLTLLQAMIAWREKMLAAGEPAVFNLSLGIDPATANLNDAEQKLVEELLNGTQVDKRASLSYEPLALDDPSAGPMTKYAVDPSRAESIAPLENTTAVALETVVRLVNQTGIVIVAAAGNEGGPEQYPAVYRPVLGVAAVGGPGTVGLAPYSNQGDVAAPGGSGDPSNCSDALCADGVLSLYATDSTATTFGLAFWSGTSFAAPLVSGIVAQRYADYLLKYPGTVASDTGIENFVVDIGHSCSDTVPGTAGAAPICVANSETMPSLP